MKQCPKCGTTYTDPSLSYCLADGSLLTESTEQQTFVKPAGEAARQVGVEAAREVPANYIPSATPTGSGSQWLKVILLVGLVLVMLLGAAGIAGALIYFNKGSRTSAVNSSNTGSNGPIATPTVSPTNSNASANVESEKLREQIANLEKKLDEQKNSGLPAANVPAAPDQPLITSSTARVNSPSDGFLALRTLPGSDIGERILRVPNGASVAIGGCLPRSRVGSKPGRWCRASYNRYSGWVFDAWLIY